MSANTLYMTSDPSNLMKAVSDLVQVSQEQQLFLATVTAITENTVTIQRTGQDPDVAEYAVLDNFPYPKVGDEVLVAKVGRGNIVVGHVLRDGLAENYLTIDTVLTIGPGGRIEDADGSTWDQDGITLRSDGDLTTDFIRFVNAAIPSEGLIQGVMSDVLDFASMAFVARFREAAAPTTSRATSATSHEARKDGSNYRADWSMETSVLDTAAGSHRIDLTALNSFPTGGGAGIQTVILTSASPDDGANAVNLLLMMNNSSGKGIVGLGNANTIPGSNPVGGGFLYAEAGALKWRGSSGTISTIAVA